MITVNMDEVEQLEREAYLTRRSHPTLPLHVLSYTPKTQAKGYWTELTSLCRGLVVDEWGWIVSRPFPKFHHWDQIVLPEEPPLVYDKVDGSLIVVSWFSTELVVNSRTSFTSDHAQLARQLLRDWQPEVDYTYCFEMVSPRHRIVCDYGPTEDLILLAKIETATGAEQLLEEVTDWPGHRAPRFEIGWPVEDLDQYDPGGDEGYVFYWPDHGLRAKAKFSEYVRLHGLLTGISSKDVWRALATGVGMDSLKENVPDEFLAWIEDQEQELRNEFSALKVALLADFQEIVERCSGRKQFAEEVARHPGLSAFPSVAFKLYDDKDPDPLIWKAIEPERSLPFWNRNQGEN